MREIKFRAFDKQQNTMLMDIEKMYDNLGRDGNQSCWEVSSFGDFLDDDNFSVMQYTGLKDKNGVEIYEGDILKYFHFTDSRRRKHYIKHIVEWSDKFSGWFLRNVTAKTESDGCAQAWVILKNEKPEVIGNIYENPELLK